MLARADLGLSGVDYVIAETGTLVLMARAGQMRGVSLLPPVHVAVARTSQVHCDPGRLSPAGAGSGC